METIKNLLKLLGSLFLIFLALGVVIIITPFALYWKIYVSITEENRKAREIIEGSAGFFVAIASSIDKFGNAAFGGFLNDLLLKRQRYSFGNNYETISEVLGWAERYNDLNPVGLWLLNAVNFLDPFTEDHCRSAMVTGAERAKMKAKLYNQLNPPE